MDPTTFKDPRDPTTRGRRWADEAHALLAKIEPSKASFPLLQGLICMFVYEGDLGAGTAAIPCFMRAMDVYKTLNEQEFSLHRAGVDEARVQRERQATSWCMWGFYCCEWYV